ncbi:MAG: tetratricopeptide repeat protein, partial [Bacteroidia bacterium]
AIEDAKQALSKAGAPKTEAYKTAQKTLTALKDKLGDLKRTAALSKGIKFLKHAIELHPRYVNGYLNLGLASFKLKNDYDALFYWKYNAERLYPNNPYLRSYYQVYEIELRNRGALAAQRGRWDSAAIAYNKWTILSPQNSDAWTSLAGAYFNQAKFKLSYKSIQEALKYNPGNPEAKRIQGMITPQLLGIVTQPTQVPAVPKNSR